MTKFIADAMLGKLARWLRILGYDTLYFGHTKDRDLLDIASREGRVLLTKDTRLRARGGDLAFFIESNYWVRQLLQVMETFHLDWEGALFSRCLVCNEILMTVEKEEVKDLVPLFVFSTQERFARCPQCRRVYWEGTHFKRMKNRLSEIMQGKSDIMAD